MHPSIKRAKEILAQRDVQEAEFAAWRAEHAEELSEIHSEEILTKRARANVIRKRMTVDTKPSSDLKEFFLCTATPDRMKDIVRPEGLILDHFLKNPVCPYGHDSGFIVATWGNVGLRNGGLCGHLNLAKPPISPRVDEIVRLVEAGLIRGASIGFIPLESHALPSGGREYTSGELIEVSLTSQPANAECLAIARALNVSDDSRRRCFLWTVSAPMFPHNRRGVWVPAFARGRRERPNLNE